MKLSLLPVLTLIAVAAQGQASAGERFGFWEAHGEYGVEFPCSLGNWAVDAGAAEMLAADRINLHFVWRDRRGKCVHYSLAAHTPGPRRR